MEQSQWWVLKLVFFFQSHTHEFQCISCCGNLAQPESNSEETQNRLEKQFLDDFFSKLQVFRIALELRKIALELRKIALELRPTILHFFPFRVPESKSWRFRLNCGHLLRIIGGELCTLDMTSHFWASTLDIAGFRQSWNSPRIQ